MSGRTPPFRPPPGAIAWCLLALLPVATAVGFDTAGPGPTDRPGSITPPGLAFDQYLVNLGRVFPPQAEHRAFFAFTNTGSTRSGYRPSPQLGVPGPETPQKATWEPGEGARCSP
ncbi:MAG: hypothetical protein Ct9H300mP1_08440 [Planctomycetaceae bacterium]|nr:MAG: hypothetical protein Ct9H300mP1_08440 [Planctomycetaceae bacterium]